MNAKCKYNETSFIRNFIMNSSSTHETKEKLNDY